MAVQTARTATDTVSGNPRVFSQRREYTTCALYPPSIIAGDKVYTCIDPNGLNFAVIESSMFMTWQKAIGGRLKSDPSFSNTLVWNTLPLPRLSDEQRQQVIDASKRILEARANHSGQSLADLYDPTFMPVDLRKAHEQLDKVVDIAFGAVKPCADDEERLRILFTSYAEIAQMRGSKH
ncbi:type IIL restriction-modification enzyme MmeI [Bifidobacterium bifidum]|uniref:type IIL restriction-modification enzyme MmeI n=1 Tax=Bifidobacterium bifidum TaxID=1681 RepID=UPI003D077E56